DVTKRRLGSIAKNASWLCGDITQIDLTGKPFDVWHDRAVFHFLTSLEQRVAYVRQVARAVKRGGHVLVSTFGPEGPQKCSGLDVFPSDSESLHAEFGIHFQLLESLKELHETPLGASQQFLYCLCRVE